MNFIHDKKKPIEFFFPRLATLDAVEAALREEFGTRTPVIINKLKTCQALVDDEVGVHAIIVDLVRNESEAIKSLRVRRQEQMDTVYDKIYITIMRFGSGRRHHVYWIQGGEYGDAGYFETMRTVKLYADIMYLA